ncbi:MAG: ABC transporter substrate-binding protein [Trichodesmium sp. ALOHA_ZT_67]|nr:ABC transporter substrate-binding protein [Trichodesmium sp. ALOHA_ZT_67]
MNNSKKRRNPYIVGPIIDEPELFFGRESLFEFIKDNLKNNQQVILLYGQRRIGKSSVLRQIPNKVNLDDEFVFVPSDFQHKSQWSLHEIVSELAQEIVKKLIVEKLIDNPDQINQTFLDDLEKDLKQDGVKFREFLDQVCEKFGDKKLVLLLDEFDVLDGENSQSEFEDLFRYLKSIIFHEKRLFIIPVVGRRLDDMPKLHSNLLREAPQQRIGLLDQLSAQRLITNPAEQSLEYDQEAIEEIIKLSAGHPYFIQGICHTLFGQARRSRKKEIHLEDVKQVVDLAIESLEPGLIWFRDGLPILERIVFSAVATAQEQNPSSEKKPFDLLKDLGVDIEHSNLHQASKNLIENKFLDEDGYKITVKFVCHWLVKYHPLKSIIWEFEEVEENASEYYKKADIWRKQRKIEDELYHYKKALELNPNHFSALLSLAELYLNQEEFLKALERYERVYKVDPVRAKDGYIESFRGAIKLHLENHKFQEALELYERIYKVDPVDAKKGYIDSFPGAIKLHLKNRKFQEASELYKQACQLNIERAKDEYINILQDLANLYVNNQKSQEESQFKEALELYELAYEANPERVKDKYIELLLSYLRFLNNNRDLNDNKITAEVKTNFNKVLEIDPENKEAQEYLSNEDENLKRNAQIRNYKNLKRLTIGLVILIFIIILGGIAFLVRPNLKSNQLEPELSSDEKQKRFSSGGKRIIVDRNTNKQDYNNDFSECNKDFKKKKYSEAAGCFEELVKSDSNEPESLIYKNNALNRNRQSTNSQLQIVSIAVIVSADQDEKSKEMLRGVAQAQHSFNEKKSYSANPRFLLEIVIVDDSNDPDSNDPNISLKVAREIVKNKSILGVIGNLSKDALGVYKQENLAVISPTSISNELNSETLFTTIDYKILSKKLAEYVQQLDVEKVVIFYNQKSSSSKSIKDYFKFYFPSSKLIREVDLKQQSFDSEVESAIEEKFEVGILFPDSETVDSAIEIAKINYLNQEEQQLKLLGSNDLYYCDILKKGKQAVKGLILAVPWFKGTPEAKNFSTEVKDRWGGEVSWLTAASYDGTQAFISAISSLSNSDENPTRSTVLQKVKEVNLPAKETSGENLRFSPEGEREGKAILVEVVDNSSNPDCSNLDFRPVEE